MHAKEAVEVALLTTEGSDTDSFWTTVDKKLKSLLLKNVSETISDATTNEEDDRSGFISKINSLSNQKSDEENIKIIDQSRLIVVPPYHCYLSEIVVGYIRNQVNNHKIAIVFLRGIDPTNLAYRMGYTKSHYVQWGYGKTFCINFDQITRLMTTASKKEELLPLVDKYGKEMERFWKLHKQQTEIKESEIPEAMKVGNYYLTGVQTTNIVNYETDWINLATCKGDSEDGCGLLLHKSRPILFLHWYGYDSQETPFCAAITLSMLRFLIYEHTHTYNDKLFYKRLLIAAHERKLSDLVIEIEQ